ncbi:MAG: amino acid adenylation domain-containing protein, partial [Melioribacteraceae bacterium]|nr:amino acid adenylation domain-containing protein [Melioribacteraceae bacterium]
ELNPNKTALICGNRQMTFKELRILSDNIAFGIKQKNIAPGELIGLFFSRVPEAIATMLGIMKAGCAYVPLDPNYPKERINYIVEDAGIKTIVHNIGIARSEKVDNISYLDYRILNGFDSNESVTETRPESTSDDLAYVIYTSGSTGNPKGVKISHGNLTSFTELVNNRFSYEKNEIFLQSASFSFALSVRQIFTPLLISNTLVIAEKEQIENPLELFRLIKTKKITTVDFVPSFLRSACELLEDLNVNERNSVLDNNLARIISIGEVLSKEVVNRWFNLNDRPIKFFNIYGQSETTGIVSAFQIEEDILETHTNIPIGKPLAGIQIHILDSNRCSLSENEIGEIFIESNSVGKGYLNNVELTRQKFVSNPNNKNSTLYRTGDLGKYLPDGNIEILGRVDSQIKINGVRIDPSEIETAINNLQNIRTSVVVPVENQQKSTKTLVAFLVLSDEKLQQNDNYRELLKNKLPAIMIPSKFITKSKLPQTPSGKIDRKALIESLSSKSSSRTINNPIKKRINLNDWLYKREWQKTDSVLLEEAEFKKYSKCLIFSDRSDVSNRLAESVKKQGVSTSVIYKSNETTFAEGSIKLDPSDKENIFSVMSNVDIKPEGNTLIIYLWNIDGDFKSTTASAEIFSENYFLIPLYIVQALASVSVSLRANMVFVTTDSEQILESDRVNPGKSFVRSIVQNLFIEYKRIRGITIDFDSGAYQKDPKKTCEIIQSEISSSSNSIYTAYRHFEKYLLNYLQNPSDKTVGGISLKQNGVYLITGGLGVIGLKLAEYLAQKYHANLILTSRSVYPDNSEWKNILAKGDSVLHDLNKIETLQRIEELSSSLTLKSADIGNYENMKSVVDYCAENFGNLDGVFHAAGILDEFNYSASMSKELVLKTFYPKVTGSIVLSEVLKNRDLDFVLYFSSISSIIGRSGKLDYVAANEFQNYFARFNNSENQPHIVIDWDTWEGRILTETETEFMKFSEALDSSDELSFTFNEGFEVLEKTLSLNSTQVIVSTGDLRERILASFEMIKEDDNVEFGNSSTVIVLPRNKVESEMLKVWENVFPETSISVDSNFFELGGNSLMAVNMMAKIKNTFGKSIPPSILIEQNTIEKLANVFQNSFLNSEGNPVIKWKAEAPNTPFFLFAPNPGTLGFHEFSRAMDKDQPIIIIEPKRFQHHSMTSVEEKAKTNIEHIKSIQPKGPYYIGGYCSGALTAFQAANMLNENGDVVKTLVLFDYIAEKIGGYFDLLGSAHKLKYKAARILYLIRKYLFNPKLLLNTTKVISEKNELIKEHNSSPLQHAKKQYKIQRYKGDIIYFKAYGEKFEALGLPFAFEKEADGWKHIAEGKISVELINCVHDKMFVSPHAEETAKRLQQHLNAQGIRN